MILPPDEGFASGSAGAIGHFVHHQAAATRRFQAMVIGPAQPVPFADVAFRPAALSWLPGTRARRYARGVARVVRAMRPAVIEVHDQPEIARRLAAAFRPTPVIIVLHSDPQAMPGTGGGAGRTLLLAHVTRAVAVAAPLRDRLLEGVHPAMRSCAVLPQGTAAIAAVLDALRDDARDAWSQRLDVTI